MELSDQVKQFEQQVFAAIGSSDQIPPDEQEAARNNLFLLYQNSENIGFCISNFNNFANPTSKLFTLHLIFFWINEKFQELNPEQIQFIQQFLFSPIFFENFSSIPEQIMNQLILTQSQLITKVFPEPWGSFFSDFIFSESHPPIGVFVNKFLLIFTKDISSFTPRNFDQMTRIRNFLQQSGLANQIVQYAIVKCQQNDIFGYQILNNCISLCPAPFFFENQQFQTIVHQGLSNPSVILTVLDTIRKMILKNMESGMKLQIMNLYINPSHIFELVKSTEDQNVFVGVSCLVSEALNVLQALNPPPEQSQESLSGQYFVLCTNFIEISDFLSSKVLYSVYAYMKKNPAVLIESVKQIVNRLIANFSEPTVIDNFEETITSALKYANVIVEGMRTDISVLEFIESYSSSFDFGENPGICTMLIFVINQAFLYLQPRNVLKERLPVYMNMFMSIFGHRPPFSPPQIMCLYIFYCFVVRNQKIINGPSEIGQDVSSNITSIIAQVAMLGGINEAFVNSLLKRIPKYDFKFKRLINVDPNLLDAFVQTNKPQYVSAASKLVQCLLANGSEVANHKYIEFYASQILGSEDNSEEKLNVCLAALTYLSNSFINPNDGQLVEIAQNIIMSAVSRPQILQNDQALAEVIRAATKVGYAFALHIYKDIYQSCKGFQSISSICDELCHNSLSEKNEFATELIEYLMHNVNFIIDDYIVRNKFGVKNSMVEVSIMNFLNLVGTFILPMLRLGLNDFVEHTIKNILPILNRLVEHFYDTPLIYRSCIDFMSNLCRAQKEVEQKNVEFLPMLNNALNAFIPSSFDIVFNNQIEFLSNEWRDVLKALFAFHTNFTRTFGIDAIENVLVRLGAPPGFSNSYMLISNVAEKTPIIEPTCMFYNQLSLFFKGV